MPRRACVRGGTAPAHDPHAIGFEYVRAMATVGVAALGPAPRRSAKNALCVGLGAGTLPAFFGTLLGRRRCGAVEIEEEVANVARGSVSASASRTTAEGTFPRGKKATRRRDALLDRN